MTDLELARKSGAITLTQRDAAWAAPTIVTFTPTDLAAYTEAVRQEERERAAERIRARIVEHCAAPQSECEADGSCGCEFVAAWNDAIAAILAQPEQKR